MRTSRRSPLYWAGGACILIGALLGILITTGSMALSRSNEAIVTTFVVLGGILVFMAYYRAGKK